MSETDQSIKLQIVCNLITSFLFPIQQNIMISRLVVYKKAFDVRRQGADPSTKTKNF